MEAEHGVSRWNELIDAGFPCLTERGFPPHTVRHNPHPRPAHVAPTQLSLSHSR